MKHEDSLAGSKPESEFSSEVERQPNWNFSIRLREVAKASSENPNWTRLKIEILDEMIPLAQVKTSRVCLEMSSSCHKRTRSGISAMEKHAMMEEN